MKYLLDSVTRQVRFKELTNADSLSVFSHPPSLKVVGEIYLIVVDVTTVSDSDVGTSNEKVTVRYSSLAH